MNKSYRKICPKCGGHEVKKDGKRKGKQSYKCKICNHIWINKSRGSRININKLYNDYSDHKQTYKELGKQYNTTIKTIQKYLDMYVIEQKEKTPGKTILLIDTTYFGDFGLMLFKDSKSKDILHYKIVDYETNDGYRTGINDLICKGRIIEAIVCDGRRGLMTMFPNIPTQMCHFHQKQIVRRYITKKPILKANIELNDIVVWLHRTDKSTFQCMLEKRYKKYNIWLNQKGITKEGKRYFIHKKTRSAYFSLKRNIDNLFVYLDYLDKIDIPNTTNAIESVFSHLKYKINLHRGLRKDRKIKLILSLLKI